METIAEKDKAHYRIYNQTLGTFNETNTSYFKSSIGGYHAVKLRRYDDLINEYFIKMDTVKMPRILNMLNTKYMIFGNADKREALTNADANGIAWFVSELKFVNSPNEELDQIGEVNTKKVAILSKEDQKYFEGKPLLKDSTAFLELKKYQANELEFTSESKTPQLAVFSEIYYPEGWKISIDGKEVPYIKADYLLRAVYVPAGKHSIKMIFAPEVIAKGKVISMIAFGLFLLLSGLGIWRLYRKKDEENLAM
jgi:hypothetical protein